VEAKKVSQLPRCVDHRRPNLARVSIVMYITVKICHKIYILKLNLLAYLMVCVLLLFLFCWINIFQNFALDGCGRATIVYIIHDKGKRIPIIEPLAQALWIENSPPLCRRFDDRKAFVSHVCILVGSSGRNHQVQSFGNY
jgi:hypothetical protein